MRLARAGLRAAGVGPRRRVTDRMAGVDQQTDNSYDGIAKDECRSYR
jgi:hypothetical protein